MKQDLASVVRKTSDFLGKNLTEEQITALVEHLDFKSMKSNKAVNKADMVRSLQKMRNEPEDESQQFMRKGQVGDWKNRLTEDQVKRMEEWERKNLSGSNFKFTY